MCVELEKKKDKIIDLSKENLSLVEIAKELDTSVEDLREFIFKNPTLSEGLKDLALESKAFEMFDEDNKAKDLVKAGYCDVERAEHLFDKYEELNDETLDNKLATQIGLLGSRLSQLEIKIMDSTLLPKSLDCPHCDQEGKFAVALICPRCENITLNTPDSQPEIAAQSKPLLDQLTKSADDEKDEEE